jgi:uncharacterized protein (TIGR03435 family)
MRPACAGTGLKKRTEAILTSKFTRKQSFGDKPRLAIVAALLVLTSGFSFSIAQTPAPRRFEAASVKSSKIGEVGDENSRRESIEPSSDRLTMRNVSLKSCIMWAYSIREYQLSAPEWLSDERYDIFAKAAEPVSVEQLRAMLQVLLADRLGLRLRHETRVLSVYALTGSAKAPKLREVPAGGDSEMRIADGSMIFTNTSMAQLAEHLEIIMRRQVGRPVIDETGLKGVFDFTLKFSDTNADMKAAMVQGDGAWISGIVQQQLGLKLSAEKAGIGTIIVDHADKVPTAN